jgi:NADH-quinone oxidoreductase subunit N
VTITMPSVNYLAIAPILVLLGGSLVLMMTAALTKNRVSLRLATATSVAVCAVAAVVSAFQWSDVSSHGESTTLAHAVAFDGFGIVATAIIAVTTLLATLGAYDWIARARTVGVEFHILLLASAAGAMMMAQANDLIVVFLGLEILSIGLYVLVAYDRHRSTSSEAALKYLLLGGFASALFIYGAALTYGGTGTTTLTGIAYFMAHNFILQPGVLVAGIGLMLVGFAFKVAAVPFHTWSPDVYEGAPSPVTGFMASVVKVGAFAGVLRILIGALSTQAMAWRPLVAALVILSTFLGAGLALVQQNIKRLLAYSSINHAGFMLLGLWSATPRGVAGTLYYVITYAPVVVATFTIVSLRGGANEDRHELSNYRGLARRQPLLGAALAVLLLSQAGAPFTTGFYAKFAVLTAAVDAGGAWIGVVVMVAASIAGYFYVRLVLSLYDAQGSSEEVVVPRASAVVVGVGVLSALVFGVWPGPLESLAHHAVLLLP